MLIRKAAVLGAGRMGTAVAAHLANAGIPTLLLDLVPTELTDEESAKGLDLANPKVRNRLAEAEIAGAAKGRPAAFGHPSRVGLLTPGNFDDDLARLSDVDWIVEAVVERLDAKVDLLRRVAAHLAPCTVLTTNSSGLSVNAMAAALPDEVKPRFFGTHFFFPPRYMYLLELIPGDGTDMAILGAFQEFAERRLGKGVVLGKDAPNFVANRIGIFSTVYAMHSMEQYGLTIEEVDAASGRALARAVTATFGTADLAGVDVLDHAVRNHYDTAVADEARELWRLPAWVSEMVARGLVGQKAGGSFFKEKRTLVIDPATLEYRPWQDPRQASLADAVKIANPAARVKALISAADAAGRFAWDLTAATLLYSANRLPEIAHDITAIDRAMRWGYAWDLGPFELWDALGVNETVDRMRSEGRAIPEWVAALASSASPFFYERDGDQLRAWGPGQTEHEPIASRPRTIMLADLKRTGRTLEEDEHASLIDLGDRVACVEFHTKANTVGEGVLLFIEGILARVGADYDALVIGNQGSVFSAGADLKMMRDKIQREDWADIDATLRTAQRVSMALKYASVPIVAAPFGRVLGGGLEICLHCHRVQADHESHMGLVETSVGLLPAAGGIKESLLRAMAPVRPPALVFPILMRPFDAISQAKSSGSAWEAFDLGYLRPGDGVTMNRDGLIYAAKQAALVLLETGWQPLIPVKVTVMGRDGVGNFRNILYNARGSEFISDHDRLLAEKVGWVLSGGDVDAGSEVDEAHLLDLERKAFVEVCRAPKTLERIQHMLSTGKPLRN